MSASGSDSESSSSSSSSLCDNVNFIEDAAHADAEPRVTMDVQYANLRQTRFASAFRMLKTNGANVRTLSIRVSSSVGTHRALIRNAFLKLDQLQELRITACEFPNLDIAVRMLKDHGTLKELEISQMQLDHTTCDAIASMLKHSRHIDTFSVHRSKFRVKKDAVKLISALKGHKSMRDLTFACMEDGLDGDAARALSDVLATRGCLITDLDLHGNRITPYGMGALAAGMAVAMPDVLRHLRLDDNYLGATGLAALMAVIPLLRLETLNVRGTAEAHEQMEEDAVAMVVAHRGR